MTESEPLNREQQLAIMRGAGDLQAQFIEKNPAKKDGTDWYRAVIDQVLQIPGASEVINGFIVHALERGVEIGLGERETTVELFGMPLRVLLPGVYNEEHRINDERVLVSASVGGLRRYPRDIEYRVRELYGMYWESAEDHGMPPKSQIELEERFGYTSITADKIRAAAFDLALLEGDTAAMLDIIRREKEVEEMKERLTRES